GNTAFNARVREITVGEVRIVYELGIVVVIVKPDPGMELPEVPAHAFVELQHAPSNSGVISAAVKVVARNCISTDLALDGISNSEGWLITICRIMIRSCYSSSQVKAEAKVLRLVLIVIHQDGTFRIFSRRPIV